MKVRGHEEMDFAKEAEDYINSQIDLLGMTEEEYINFGRTEMYRKAL